MPNELAVAKTTEIPPGSVKQVEVEGKPVAIFNVDGAFYAIRDTCTHAEATLSEGSVDGTTVTCPWHGARFDLKTGKNLSMPAPIPVQTYRLKIEGDVIKIVV